MLFDLLGDLISSLVGDFLVDGTTESRPGRTSRQIAAFEQDREIRIPCAVRENGERWRHGALRVRRGAATWRRRFRNQPSLTLNRRSASPQEHRRGRELSGGYPRRVVLGYQVAEGCVELAVRRRDLPIVGRVLNLPPTDW